MNNNLTKEQKNRLCKVGRRIWRMLSDDERDAYYCDTGTIGFVENVATLLHLGLCTVTLDEFERIHNYIIAPEA